MTQAMEISYLSEGGITYIASVALSAPTFRSSKLFIRSTDFSGCDCTNDICKFQVNELDKSLAIG